MYVIDIYATREEKDNSDECEVAHERSEGAKTRVRVIVFLSCSIHYFFLYAQKWPLFFPEMKHTKNVSQNIRQRQFCTNCRLLQR